MEVRTGAETGLESDQDIQRLLAKKHGSESNLNPLQRIHFREAQLAVEHVEVENIVEAQTVKEAVQAVGVVFNLDSSSPITAHESVGEMWGEFLEFST